jgi:collagenase-like PrtC family protease
MLFNVPFIPDADYAEFLNGIGKRLHAVHYSLQDPALSDARVRLRTAAPAHLVDLLKTVSGPKKYLLANARFHPPSRYQETEGPAPLLRRLADLSGAGVLDGIVFADPYLLFFLSDAAPELAARLEAVPSINFGIDSIEKIETILDLIGRTRFLPPGKIPVERTLNRDPAALSALADSVRHRLPGIRIEVLANEGCLSRCPFRAAHEALIAAANAGLGVDTLRLNRDLGCLRLLCESPHRIFASPFIRPEDVHRYEGSADIVKICGRTLGKEFLARAVDAYTKGRYAGNLTALFDTSHWMAERWEIRNEQLPADFFDMITACRQDCRRCNTCQDLFTRIARPKVFQMPDLRSEKPL